MTSSVLNKGSSWHGRRVNKLWVVLIPFSSWRHAMIPALTMGRLPFAFLLAIIMCHWLHCHLTPRSFFFFRDLMNWRRYWYVCNRHWSRVSGKSNGFKFNVILKLAAYSRVTRDYEKDMAKIPRFSGVCNHCRSLYKTCVVCVIICRPVWSRYETGSIVNK